MHTYIGHLKEEVEYDRELQSYLQAHRIQVLKYLKSLHMVIIRSEKELKASDLCCFDLLEPDKNDFSV